MVTTRRHHSGEFKARVVVEAIKGVKTTTELASEYEVHPMQITKWKKQAIEELPGIFSERRERGAQEEEALRSRLYEQVGRLQVELEWLKKKCRVEY